MEEAGLATSNHKSTSKHVKFCHSCPTPENKFTQKCNIANNVFLDIAEYFLNTLQSRPGGFNTSIDERCIGKTDGPSPHPSRPPGGPFHIGIFRCTQEMPAGWPAGWLTNRNLSRSHENAWAALLCIERQVTHRASNMQSTYQRMRAC